MTDLDFIIIRHRKENVAKCSLKGFEANPRFAFYTYPNDIAHFDHVFFENILMLDIEGEELSSEKSDLLHMPILLLDATWRYAEIMMKNIPGLKHVKRCRLPNEWMTAYPRKQADCPDPARGLASIEALYIAARLSHKKHDDLLSSYHWRDLFFERNRDQIEAIERYQTEQYKFKGAEALHDF